MDAQCQAVSRGRNLLFTSEFWYEEEEEFDSLTDNLNAKRLFLLCASSDDPCEVEWARSLLNPVVMHSGFFAPSRAAVADYMWHERGGPPLFRKMRERDALTQVPLHAL